MPNAHLHLSQIFLYPIKSLAGIAVEEAQVHPRGLIHDRRWLLVDKTGRFLSQRTHPKMSRLQPHIKGNQFWVQDLNQPERVLDLNLKPKTSKNQRIPVSVWNDNFEAYHLDNRFDDWFSEALGMDCQLVFMNREIHRPIDPDFAQNGEAVSFADGYPFLIIGTESLTDLNRRLNHPVSMRRFRPNLVFSGGLAYEEDNWKKFQIGDLNFRGVKPCARCQLITIDPDTAQKGKEPLLTLSTYRKQGQKVLFGLNACWLDRVLPASPFLRIGDPVKVLS